MLNFDKKDAHVYPFDESPGAGIIMDVDLGTAHPRVRAAAGLQSNSSTPPALKTGICVTRSKLFLQNA